MTADKTEASQPNPAPVPLALKLNEGLGPKAAGWARKQDLLEYAPCWMAYASRPAPENGHDPVALYTQDQVDRLLLALRTIKAGAGNPEFVYNFARDVLAEFGA